MGQQNVRIHLLALTLVQTVPGLYVFHANTLLLITIAFIAFPEDDRLEYDFHAEEKRHEKIQATLNSDSRAAECLARAVRFMDLCQSSMQEALGYSRYGQFHSSLHTIY
jgi:hypothetical protein